MRNADSGEERSKTFSRIGWLLAILVVALLAGPALMLVMGPSGNEDGSPVRYEPTDWICDVYIDDTGYLASDKDRDGRVDCVRDFPRGRVLVSFEGGLCDDADEWTKDGDAEAYAAWNEVLEHANRVRAELASTGS